MKEIENRFDKMEIMMNSVIVAIILLIIAIFFWPNNKEISQSNEIDSSKTQIKIIVKRINIREEATTDSKDIGDVYSGEIYTVLEHIDKDDYYWYKISTNTGIEGYIASESKNEYVEIISGVIDRTPPTIYVDKDFLLFMNGEILYDDIECIDDHSSCTISYNIKDSRNIEFHAKDDSANESTVTIKYYNIYNTYNKYFETSRYINANFEQKTIDNGILISAKYKLNETIENTKKSINYVPIITLYDENFNELELITTKYNNYPLDEDCINNSDMSLKDEDLNTNLPSGANLCINYYFDSSDVRIKYFALGFSGVENYNEDNNYLANYYSRYYIK